MTLYDLSTITTFYKWTYYIIYIFFLFILLLLIGVSNSLFNIMKAKSFKYFLMIKGFKHIHQCTLIFTDSLLKMTKLHFFMISVS